MTIAPADLARLAVLVFVGLFLLADAVLLVARPEAMWSYASHDDYLLRALILACLLGFALHLVYEWRLA